MWKITNIRYDTRANIKSDLINNQTLRSQVKFTALIFDKTLIRKKAIKISKDEKGLKDENVKKRRWWHAASLILVYHLSYILCMYTLSRYSPPAIRAAYTIYDLCTIYMTYHKENAIIHSIRFTYLLILNAKQHQLTAFGF